MAAVVAICGMALVLVMIWWSCATMPNVSLFAASSAVPVEMLHNDDPFSFLIWGVFAILSFSLSTFAIIWGQQQTCANWLQMGLMTSCPTNYIAKLDAVSLVGNDASTCCEPTCVVYTSCPEGYSLKAHPEGRRGSDTTACCQTDGLFVASMSSFFLVVILCGFAIIALRHLYSVYRRKGSSPPTWQELNIRSTSTRDKLYRGNTKASKKVTFGNSEITERDDDCHHSMGSQSSIASSATEIDGMSYEEARKVRARRLPSEDATPIAATPKANSFQEDFQEDRFVAYDPTEQGETYDIWTQQRNTELVTRSKSENLVLANAKAEAEQRNREHDAAQDTDREHALRVAEATSYFNKVSSVGRQHRARTAIVAVPRCELNELSDDTKS